MGLAIRETLPRRALLSMKKSGSQQSAIPIYSPVEEQIRYNEPENPSPGQRLLAHFRFLPGCDHLGMERRRVWRAASEDCLLYTSTPCSTATAKSAASTSTWDR